MPATARDPQGSRWRRWDPHVHMPGTLKNNQFGSMSVGVALEALASCTPAIEVAGITDYFTTASYRHAKEAWDNGAGTSIKLLFPNVELRLAIPTARGSPVNAHLLCPPDEVDGLDHFLALLEFDYDGDTYHCTPPDLMRLGRAFRKGTALDDDGALRAGAEQFKVDFGKLRQRYNASEWARRHCLVAFAAGEGDGTSGVRTTDGGFAATREEMERFSRVIFSSSPQQVEFWLGQRDLTPDQIIEKYDSVKPCLHGSDAHRAADLGVVEGDRYTWLKGDASFDTLRLACLAPDSRCHIGAAPPMAGTGHGRIAALTVSPTGWFEPAQIPINPGLVAVIGARGSGKTALADFVVTGAGSRDPFENESSFVSRIGSLLSGAISTVEWSHGETTQCDFDDPPLDDGSPRTVRYLSQQFVDRLCSSRGVSDELLAEIKCVVFNACPVEERQGATSFDELLDIRLADARVRRRTELDAVRRLGETILNDRMLREDLSRKRTELDGERRTRDGLDQQINELLATAKRGDAERLSVVTAALETRQSEVQRADRRLTQLRALRSAVGTLVGSTFPAIVADLRDEHAAAGLTDEEWEAFAPTFVGDPHAIIDNGVEVAARAVRDIAGTEDQAAAETLDELDEQQLSTCTVAALRRERTRLERLVGLDAARARKLEALTKRASDVRTRIGKLENEVEEAEKAEARAPQLLDERLKHYAAYFDALLEEEQELAALYEPLGVILAGAAAMEKLTFSVQRRVDIERWAKRGEELVDLRRAAVRGVGAIERLAEDELAEVWRAGDGHSAAEAIREFSKQHSDDFRNQGRVERSDRVAYRAWERELASWLYSADHITLAYSIEFGGLSVERLSPGTRGILLLLLYLAVDQAETDPLIIDQPEENLDPESVQSELVQLFRAASTRRQIIMVTHNANLVINTDVDQVIYARCEQVEEGKLPELRYLSGGLEDPEIRATVCEVLEGGAEAFRERARRLRLELNL